MKKTFNWNNVDQKKAQEIVSGVGNFLTPIFIKKQRAIKLIKTVIKPTVGSEFDIVFWDDVIKQIEII